MLGWPGLLSVLVNLGNEEVGREPSATAFCGPGLGPWQADHWMQLRKVGQFLCRATDAWADAWGISSSRAPSGLPSAPRFLLARPAPRG